MVVSSVGLTVVRNGGGHENASSIEGETTRRRNGTHGKCATLMRSRKELLPWIPDDITLNEIVPKLPWRAVFILSCVSPSWQEAIRSNLVYEARVRANVTETLLVHHHNPGDIINSGALSLYSLSERCCYELPPVPRLPRETVTRVTFVVLDGKLYALGGKRRVDGSRSRSSKEVFVLDLARQRKWERCASMLQKRQEFGCSVMDRKIYVFGGWSVNHGKSVAKTLLGCEVYDTQENSWSPIMPLPRGTPSKVVAKVGKELFLYRFNSRNVGAYDPAKNHWRVLKNFWKRNWSTPFIRQENFYSLSLSGIDKYDIEQNSWVNLHTNSILNCQLDGHRLRDTRNLWASFRVWAGNNDLVVVTFEDFSARMVSFHCKLGLDIEKKDLVWQETNCSCEKYLMSSVPFSSERDQIIRGSDMCGLKELLSFKGSDTIKGLSVQIPFRHSSNESLINSLEFI